MYFLHALFAQSALNESIMGRSLMSFPETTELVSVELASDVFIKGTGRI
jgi:hypothetical protein